MAIRKLTPEQDIEIYRRKLADPALTNAALAAELGVDESAISRAVQRGRKAVEGDASTPAPSAAPSPAVVATAPHGRLLPSPLNPRKRFDQDELAKLVDSVRAEDVLLPLLVRRANLPGNHSLDRDVDYEIIAGERRWRALDQLVQAGERPADHPVPIRLIDPCDDAKLLELALTENVARKDMTAWEEAEAFAALRALGRSAAEIAASVGMVKRTVEMRLRLVRDLDEPAKDALREGKISVEAANILAAMAPRSTHAKWVAEIQEGFLRTTADLKRRITAEMIPVQAALFPAEAYTGQVVEDGEDRYFTDAKLFDKLQAQAIQAETKRLAAAGHAQVMLADRRQGQYFHESEWDKDPTSPERVAVISIYHDRHVTIHTDLVKPKKASAASSATAAPADPVTKAHCQHARRRKTVALQAAMLDQPRVAMMAACLAMLGCNRAVRIKTEPLGRDDKALAPAVRQVIEEFLPAINGASRDGFKLGDGEIYAATWWSTDEAAVWQALDALPEDRLQRLFAALVAQRVGSFGSYDPTPGDVPPVLAMAGTLGLAGNEAAHGLAIMDLDLEGLRRDALMDVKRQVAPDCKVADLKLGELKSHLLAMADRDYVLPTLRYGTEEEVRGWLKTAPADPRQIDLEDAIASKAAEIPPPPLPPTIDEIRKVLAPLAPGGARAEVDTDLAGLIDPSQHPMLARALAARFGVQVSAEDFARAPQVADLIALVDLRRMDAHRDQLAAATAEAQTITAPSDSLAIGLELVRGVLCGHSLFADKADGRTGLMELIGEEDLAKLAGDLAQTFALPTITEDVLLTIEDLDHLVRVMEDHRQALQQGEAA